MATIESKIKSLWLRGYSRNAISSKLKLGHQRVQSVINKLKVEEAAAKKHEEAARERIIKGAEKGAKISHKFTKIFYVYLGYHASGRTDNNNHPREFDVAMVEKGDLTTSELEEMALNRVAYSLAQRYGKPEIEAMEQMDEIEDNMSFLHFWKIGIEYVPKKLKLPRGLWMVNDYERVYSPYFWMGVKAEMVQIGKSLKKKAEWYDKLIEYRKKLVTLDLDDGTKKEAKEKASKLKHMLRDYGARAKVSVAESTHEGHYHVKAVLNKELDWPDHFMIREALGDDPDRIVHDKLRIEMFQGQGEVLFSKKMRIR